MNRPITISTKQLQLTGVAIIREDLVKRTPAGKIYNAILHYGENRAEVKILYKRSGRGIVLGPRSVTENSISELNNLMAQISRKIPFPDYKNLAIIRTGIVIAIMITLYNLTAAPIITIPAIIVNVTDIAITTTLIALYRRERETYVKVKK